MRSEDAIFFTLLFGALLTLLYVWMIRCNRGPSPPRRRPCPTRYREAFRAPTSTERFATEAPATADPLPDIQSAIDFSDVTVPESDRTADATAAADAEQLQTIDDRFRAAKRSVAEHKLKSGVYTNAQRRKLVEALLRRPPCGRRVRSCARFGARAPNQAAGARRTPISCAGT